MNTQDHNVLRLILVILATILFMDTTAGASVEDLVVFRDSLKPGSAEAHDRPFNTEPWSEKERAFALRALQQIHSLAPALLPRGASDKNISLYRASLPGYAKGGVQRMAFDKKAFIYPDYSSRVILHEVVHTADAYDRMAGSEPFRKIFEPKIEHARALLKREGLTPATAAALPIGKRRQRIERAVRTQTGLPSAYAARDLEECLAEVISFWISPEYNYTPDPQAVPLLTPFVQTTPGPDPVEIRFREAQALQRMGQTRKSIELLDQIIREAPYFHQALSLRGFLFLALNKPALAANDLKRSRELVSPLQRTHAFYDTQWRRAHQLAAQRK